jgi:SpoVK/Ycf46/Vps4 family AAA+-type ATPase
MCRLRRNRKAKTQEPIRIDAPKAMFEPDIPVRLDGPGIDSADAEVRILRSRLERVARQYVTETGGRGLLVSIEAGDAVDGPVTGFSRSQPGADGDRIVERDRSDRVDRASQFVPQEPRAGFELLVISSDAKERLLTAVSTLSVSRRVFEEWNLKSIEPAPLSAINLHGPPGTGKTLAAHAIARHLGKPLMLAKTSQLESMYHGESAKNVEALFRAANQHDAVLFIDEADTLLSRRIASPMQAAEQAVNAMRSELFLSLDSHAGVVIFATNLVEAYDPAFYSRVTHVAFPLPDDEARREIWRRHLPSELPLSEDVSIDELAAIPGVSGRDIKRAVVTAAVAAARRGFAVVHQHDFVQALEVATAGPMANGEFSSEMVVPDVTAAVREALGHGEAAAVQGTFEDQSQLAPSVADPVFDTAARDPGASSPTRRQARPPSPRAEPR